MFIPNPEAILNMLKIQTMRTVDTVLTHSCLQVSGTLLYVVWTSDSFENNVGIKCVSGKYLKENCLSVWDSHFSFKCFIKIAF